MRPLSCSPSPLSSSLPSPFSLRCNLPLLPPSTTLKAEALIVAKPAYFDDEATTIRARRRSVGVLVFLPLFRDCLYNSSGSCSSSSSSC